MTVLRYPAPAGRRLRRMNILLALIPISLGLLGLAIWAFVWAVRKGQYDDLDGAAVRILDDDAPRRSAAEPKPAVAKPR